MGVLTYRAEQALLGAMLQRPELVGMLDYLEPGDFARNQHRVLYNAMTQTSMAGKTGAGEWRAAVEAAIRPQLSADYLDEIQAACPDPRHGPAYGAMVMEASARRTVADPAEDIASEAGALEYDTGRLVRAVGAAGHEMDNDALHLARVAAAMRVHSARFNPDTSTGVAGPAEAGEPPVLSGPVTPAVAAAWEEAGRTAGAESEQATAEARVLAALIQGHRETRQVMGMLSGGAFADPLRREVFQAVRTLFASGRPIDPLTVDWELTRSRSLSCGRETPTPSAADSGESYVTRLARTTVGDGPVTRTADALLSALSRPGNGLGTQHSISGLAARPGRGQKPVRGNSGPIGPSPDLFQPPPRIPGPDRGNQQRM